MELQNILGLAWRLLVGIVAVIVVVAALGSFFTWPMALWWHFGESFWIALGMQVIWIFSLL